MIFLKHAIVQSFFWEVLMSSDISKWQRTEPQNRNFNGLVQVQVFVNGSGSVRFGWGVDQFGSSLYRFKQFDGLGLTFDKFLKYVLEHFEPSFNILRKIFKILKF